MDIVWKDTLVDPSENLTKLSQFTGAYAITTIDKRNEILNVAKGKTTKNYVV